MTTIARIFNLLREGPASAYEIAVEIDRPMHNVSALLALNFRRGKIQRKRVYNTGMRGHRYLYYCGSEK